MFGPVVEVKVTGRFGPYFKIRAGPDSHRAIVTAQAGHEVSGRACPGTMNTGPYRVWAGLKNHASCRAVGSRAFCTSISNIGFTPRLLVKW